MSFHFVEFPGFTEVVEYYLKDDEGYAQLQTYLSVSYTHLTLPTSDLV